MDVSTGDSRQHLILERLRAAPGFVSGSALAQELGVSRAAVSKRVRRLRAAGWQIDAVPRRGYQLRAEPDSLDPLVVQSRLVSRRLGARYHHFDGAVDSTNEEAARLGAEGAPDGTLVVAASQRRGRGRMGRSWVSPGGSNLYLSLLLRPPWTVSEIPPLPLAAAVAVAETLETVLEERPTVKWPNDVLFAGKKLCGILCELAAEADRVRHVIVGVGLNVNQRRFARSIAAGATSMALVGGRRHSRVAVLVELLSALERRLEQLQSGEAEAVLDDWLGYADWLGRRVTVALSDGGELSGDAVGIDTSGALRLRRRGEIVRIVAGDVILGPRI